MAWHRVRRRALQGRGAVPMRGSAAWARQASGPAPTRRSRWDRLRLSGVAPGTLLAHDGEVTDMAGEMTLEKLPEALSVDRPPPGN
jgi:hypothetical protein